MLEIKSKKQGAEITSIKFNRKEMLFQGKEVLDSEGKSFWNRQAPILFPIVGQIKDGKTFIENDEYYMSQHGFARDMEFEEIVKNYNEHKYLLKYDEETLKKYPYKFELEVTYIVIENTLNINYKVKNKDEKKIYFGLGAHPAFICDYSSGEYNIEFEKAENEIEFLKLKNGLIDTEKADNILKNSKIIHLEKNTFDNDAIIMENIKSNKVVLKNEKQDNKILEFDFSGFPYLAIWSKKGAPFVCIEPWFNTADKIDSDGQFKNKENILELDINKVFECNYKIIF